MNGYPKEETVVRMPLYLRSLWRSRIWLKCNRQTGSKSSQAFRRNGLDDAIEARFLTSTVCIRRMPRQLRAILPSRYLDRRRLDRPEPAA